MDPQRFVGYLKIFGRLTMTWPPDSNSSSRSLFINNCVCCLVVISNIFIMSFIFLNIRNLNQDPVGLSKSLSLLFIVGDSTLHLILIRIRWTSFEILINEVIGFLGTAKRQDKMVFRKYVKRYFGYHSLLAGFFIIAIGTVITAPLTMKKRFPFDARYPFSTDPPLNRILVYILQYIAIAQTLSLASGDFIIITLLWYASARLELLGLEFQRVDAPFHLRVCVKKHQDLVRFVRKTQSAIRLILVKSICAMSIVLVTAGLQLSNHRTVTVLSQFFVIACAGSLRLFGCAWAGDDLTEVGYRLSWSIYQSPAIERSTLDLGKSISIVIRKSQDPLMITLFGLRQKLSLDVFATYLISVVSAFMTLRAIVDRYA